MQDFYDVRITFRKLSDEEKIVNVNIRYKKRKSRKTILPFPENINEKELQWTTFRGEPIINYHRRSANLYVGPEDTVLPTSFGQKLETLLTQALKGKT